MHLHLSKNCSAQGKNFATITNKSLARFIHNNKSWKICITCALNLEWCFNFCFFFVISNSLLRRFIVMFEMFVGCRVLLRFRNHVEYEIYTLHTSN